MYFLGSNRLEQHTQLNVYEKEGIKWFLYLIQIFGLQDSVNLRSTHCKAYRFIFQDWYFLIFLNLSIQFMEQVNEPKKTKLSLKKSFGDNLVAIFAVLN